MTLSEAVLAAPDLESASKLLEERPVAEVREAIEELASHVLRELRVDVQKAYRVADRADAATRGLPDGLARARSRWVKGHALAGLQRTDEAIDCYRTAAAEYEKIGRPADVARVAIGHVNALTYEGRYREALQLGETARRTLLRTGQHPAAARLDMNLGNLYYRLELPTEALKCYDRALRAARRLESPEMVSLIRLNRATSLAAVGRLREAELIYEEVAGEADRNGERGTRAFVDCNLGYLRFQQGDYDQAVGLLDGARTVFEEQGDDHWRTLTLIDLTELLLEVGSYQRAATMAEETQRATSRLGLRFEHGRATLYLAIASMGAGRTTAASTQLEAARSAFREEGNNSSAAICDVYLGEISTRAGDPERGAELLTPAVELFDRERLRVLEVGARVSLAAALVTRGQLAAAREQLTRAGTRLRRVPSPWLRARRSHVAGTLAEAEGNPGMALRHYRRSIRELESIRGRLGVDEFRVSFADQRAEVWGDLVELVLQRGGPDPVAEAFALVEQSRSRALVDLLAGRLQPESVSDPKAAKLLRELDTLRAEMNRLRGFSPGQRDGMRRSIGNPHAVRKCEARISETLARLERRSSSLGALTRGETYSLEQAQQDLEPDTQLVEYFLGSRGCWALVVDRERARAIRLPTTAADISRAMTRFRFQIEKCCHGQEYVESRQDMLLAGVQRHLQELSRTLWAPLSLDHARVIVIPHASLHSLPFAALPTAAGRAVLDDHRVSVLPSASCRRYVAPSSARRGSDLRVLAIDVGLPDLPEARREVDVVRGLFRRGRTLRGPRATRDAFRQAAPAAHVIHLATHGLFRPDDSRFSSVLLADGWMSVHDIYGLRLNAELVCLSACQSGRSWIGAGDEIMGLTRGFLHAGAAALLVSLWPVDDAATADLMVSFYAGIRRGLPLDEALGQAMRAVRETRPHPSYWAPFVLLGGSGGSLQN